MKRSEEILRIIKLTKQAIEFYQERIEFAKNYITQLNGELKEITDGVKPDETITL